MFGYVAGGVAYDVVVCSIFNFFFCFKKVASSGFVADVLATFQYTVGIVYAFINFFIKFFFFFFFFKEKTAYEIAV